MLARAHGNSPILLLDNVSSEFDTQRNEYLFDHLANLAGQCFIATTHPGEVLLRQHYRCPWTVLSKAAEFDTRLFAGGVTTGAWQPCLSTANDWF